MSTLSPNTPESTPGSDKDGRPEVDGGEHDLGGGITMELPNPLWKRVMDITCITLALPVIALVALLIGAWVKLSSRGPVLFTQERVGRGGRLFKIYKFRSMVVGANDKAHESHVRTLISSGSALTKLDAMGDQRMILGGALLRATGMDELPQLINVLVGDMSLVGPRPIVPAELEHYRPEDQRRLAVLPGLTGYWQVNGKNKTTFEEMVAKDLYYVDHRSPLLDIGIMIKTPIVLIGEFLSTAAKRLFAVKLSPKPAQRS